MPPCPQRLVSPLSVPRLSPPLQAQAAAHAAAEAAAEAEAAVVMKEEVKLGKLPSLNATPADAHINQLNELIRDAKAQLSRAQDGETQVCVSHRPRSSSLWRIR
jgi:hypothetical protein